MPNRSKHYHAYARLNLPGISFYKLSISMKETLLHYVWRARRFDLNRLQSTTGQSIQILLHGLYNQDSGPDFLNAKIRIDDTLWIGHIEMHLKSSDWIAHQHQNDPAYENVILHVVLDDDTPIYYPNQNRIPCLEIGPYINQNILENYERLQFQESFVPCENHLSDVPEMVTHSWLDRMLHERLHAKAIHLEANLKRTNHDWEESFYLLLARGFGFKKNGEAMEELARRIPFRILKKHADHQVQIDAMLYGTAGLLNQQSSEDYPTLLKREYQFLKRKYALREMNPVYWQFLRMRPSNFPTIRIAQFSSLIVRAPDILNRLIYSDQLNEVRSLFERLEIHAYWNTHYHFKESTTSKTKLLGKTSIDLLLINVFIPFLYSYGKRHEQIALVERAIDWLCALKPERNHILKKWKSTGMPMSHAGHAQGLLHLKKQYCDQKACTNCAIGHAILSG